MEYKALPTKYIAEHYNGRIFKCYAVYLRNRYGTEVLQKICRSMDISEAVLVNETSWFSNEFFIDFLDLMKIETGDELVSEKAGEIFVNPEVVSPLEYASLASKFSPYLVLRLLPTHYRKYNRINKVKMVSGKPGEFKFIAFPSSKIIAPIEVCGSTISMVGSIKNLFNLDYAEVRETQCIHKGASECSFVVHYSGKSLWRKRLLMLAAFGVLTVSLTLILGGKIKTLLSGPDSGYFVVSFTSLFISTIFIMVINNLRKVSLLSFYFQQSNEISNSLASERAARAREAARIDLAHEVAHDIRSPVAALEVASTLPASEERLELEKRALNRIREITSLLVGIAKPARLETIEVTELLKDVIDEKHIELTAKGSKPEIILSVVGEHHSIEGYKTKFCRALSNILNNAVDASSEGSVIEVIVRDLSSGVGVSIRDSGKGIPETLISNVGKRGYTYSKSGGSGLGVFLAKECVEEMSGRFFLTSQEGVGTKVEMIFPKSTKFKP